MITAKRLNREVTSNGEMAESIMRLIRKRFILCNGRAAEMITICLNSIQKRLMKNASGFAELVRI